MQPKQIKRTSPNEITFIWDDDRESIFTTDFLRGHCPCATCLHEQEENRRQGLFSLPIANQTELRSLELSGRNAIVITWGDGHKTGIYTWEYLRNLDGLQ
ncbi:MAG: DUF971 domain-containing protein [Bacteroidetes bacterium]|nr:DUF971 domain-containing protein [Bacteroidota bacterium]MCW5896934.1 DUF971 domain-containing protein [Bacteroidota bacterium]